MANIEELEEKYPHLHEALVEILKEQEDGAQPFSQIDETPVMVDSMIDGMIGVLLENVVPVCEVGNRHCMQKGEPELDLCKVRLARVKVIRGLLEMMEGLQELTEALPGVFGQNSPFVIGVLREYADLTELKNGESI